MSYNSNNISYSTHSYNIQNLTQLNLSTLNSTFSNQINYLLNFYKSHKIKHLNLQTSYQITLTLLNSSNLDLLKLISLLTYLNFNNIKTTTNLISLINQLQFTPNSQLILIDSISEIGEIIETNYYFKTLD